MVSTSRFSLRAMTLAVAAASAGFSLNASASMGNIGTTYGVMPVDVATAQSLSMFNEHVSATYYNPSYLTSDERGELTGGILHAEQELRSSRSDADGDIISDSPSQHVLIGMKTNLASLTRFDHPIYLGFIAGVEKYGKEMLAFSSETSETGQYLQYGKEPLFLNIGGATPLWRGISGGFSVRVTLEAAAQLDAVSTLGGETSRERLAVNAEPSLKSILGTTIKWGDTFCPDSDCFLDGWESAITYRTKSSASTSVDSNIIVTQTIPDPGLSLAVATIDSFQPETFAIGTQYKGDGWRIGGSIEQQNWSELEDEFAGDTIKDQENVSAANRIRFDDILVPRIGAEYQLSRHFAVRGGLAYEESPLKTTRNPELNYLDTDKIVAGLGISATYERTRVLAYPVRLDIGYQYQQLQDRDFTIVDYDGNEQQATADGDVHVISGSITLKF
ncbi:Long-chain fatty acid transport protein [Marinobacter salarius]|jgi:long-subunit fatty acid transport protein|uniref:Aromatic hydrocarbon degradation protein n=1 Tax=Marinobacter salarius TaxID=1420917 RepID=W5YP25_9GAMM|nr:MULTISPECIES: alkane uptake protein AupA [Marinobacter]MBL83380.1 aromatic hydrocarbon degradation protein [Marinobacter sp.]AHI30805.1 aromatic hydrocarbon degradation protein [Marinobacter salarius]KXJ44680.1 MAG: aromatic hydrocarbon degradation protein [Marinobacter sp. Hex_13]MBS8233155.1 aromatic hydrocarbon degradation protein [Marinobacter salarius]SFL67000.1 Long-chain fatty acid transport protein [Marinobacter salarius]|tara:strand:+ start:5154 stop:6491 length:1338 start_codon:yes stop_codon:yes gene_type:complete